MLRRMPILPGNVHQTEIKGTMLSLFLLQLLAGISLMWCLLPREQITAGFFRIQMLLALGLAVLIILAGGSTPGDAWLPVGASVGWQRGLMVPAALTAYVGSVLWTLERRRAATLSLKLIATLSLVALWLSSVGVMQPMGLGLLSTTASAATVGGSVTGMLLGHWYLTAPTMSIAPLQRLTWILTLAVGFRLLVSAWAWGTNPEPLHGSLLLTWLVLRWLAGIFTPLVLCGMTLRILRYRNTQAATGVLFATVIVVFIGEISALLLGSEVQHPF